MVSPPLSSSKLSNAGTSHVNVVRSRARACLPSLVFGGFRVVPPRRRSPRAPGVDAAGRGPRRVVLASSRSGRDAISRHTRPSNSNWRASREAYNLNLVRRDTADYAISFSRTASSSAGPSSLSPPLVSRFRSSSRGIERWVPATSAVDETLEFVPRNSSPLFRLAETRVTSAACRVSGDYTCSRGCQMHHLRFEVV